MKIKDVTEGFMKGFARGISPETYAAFKDLKTQNKSPDIKAAEKAPLKTAPTVTPAPAPTKPKITQPKTTVPVTGSPFTVKLPTATVTRDTRGKWFMPDGNEITDTNSISRLNAYAASGVSDPVAQQAADAKASAEMLARIRAREKQTTTPVDVSAPTLEPIKLGKEVIKPEDPRYAKLAAALAKQK